MKKNNSSSNVTEEKKKSKLKTICIIIATIVAVITTVKLVVKFFSRKNNLEEKINVKDIFVFMESKRFEYAEKISSGIIINSHMGIPSCDFTSCDFADNTFISIKSVASIVNITVPTDINVKFDYVNTGSFIKWNISNEYDEHKPTVYIALKTVGSFININQA